MKPTNQMQIALELAQKASEEIRKIYYGSMETTMKSDNSPVTNADILANKIIVEGLQKAFPKEYYQWFPEWYENADKF